MADEQLISVFKEGVHASYRVACLTTVPRVTNITRKSSFKPLGGGGGGGVFFLNPFGGGGGGGGGAYLFQAHLRRGEA